MTISSAQRGITFVRIAAALANTRSLTDAYAFASGAGGDWRDVALALKAAIDPTNSTSAAGLVADQGRDFATYLSPLTIVPRVEPRSMSWISPGPVTSTTACIRDTVSSSRRRCEEANLPILMTGSFSVSSRTNWSPLKI